MAEEITLADLQSAQYNYYLALISFTILYYDYILTVTMERERVWKTSRLNWGTGFFYFNRYACLLGHIPVMVKYFWSTSNPRKLETFHRYLVVQIQVVVGCMLVMRVYALYGGRRFVLWLYFFIMTGAAIISVWSLTVGMRVEPRRDVDLPIGCGVSVTHFYATRCAIAWGGMLVFDALVFSMTLYQSIRQPRLRGTSLISVLFRDGAVYFGVIATVNFTNILTFLLGSGLTRGSMTTFTNIISSVMISRLVLNLRHPSLVSHAPRTSHPDATDEPGSSLSFTGHAGTNTVELLELETAITEQRKYNFDG